MAPVADYLTINISSPNTPGLRALQDAAALDELLAAVGAARPAGGPPIFLKVAPDLAPADVDAIARVAIDRGIDALIVANTTVSRPPLASRHAGEAGGPVGRSAQGDGTGAAARFPGRDGRGDAADRRRRHRQRRRCLCADQGRGEPRPALHGPGLWRTAAGAAIEARLCRLLAADGHADLASAIGADDRAPR